MVDVARVAAGALKHEVRSAWVVDRQRIAYDPFLAGRRVDRIRGWAQVDDATGSPTSWSAVVKRTAGPDLRAARREAAAYRRGIAAASSGRSLSAPALLAVDDGDDHVELWLEDLQDEHAGRWPVARFGVAAEHIARWDVEGVGTDRLVGFDSETGWAERHGQPQRVAEALADLQQLSTAPGIEDLMAELGDDGLRRTRSMIRSTPARIDVLSRLPQTLLHHDLVRSNLFALPDGRTAAIDWENVGPGPFAVDLAPMVSGSVRRGEASGDDLPDIERAVLDGYRRVLAEVGCRTDDIVDAYQLALGLRWHVVLGTMRAWLDPTTTRIRGSRPEELRQESLHHLVILARHLLAAADGHPG